MDVCTIIAKNYAPYARVLARSHSEHHPGSKCFVLVIDETEGHIDPAEEPFELVTIPEIGIERYDRMAALYNVLELSTAVKPWLLKHLLGERGIERLAYLDPDIRIFDPLTEIDDLLREHQLVVTPHTTEPMPRDGRKPSETEILTAGVYNLGFIGMSRGAETDHLLDWWAERLERDCVLDPEKGFFVDQRWIDFAPGLVDSFHILRDPGYNVAYWNLASRELRRAGDDWEVNGRPLRFFHFSGYKPELRDNLSTHQNRFTIKPGSALAQITSDYADELLAADYETASRWPYTYRALPTGVELDSRVRAVYREATARGEFEQSVFEPEGAAALTEYLNGPADVGGHSGVTRYLHALWEEEKMLQTQFPDLRGVDAIHLVAWANTNAGAGIPQHMLPSNSPLMDSAGATGPRSGVNLAGYFRSVLGLGAVARGLVDALEGQNVAVAPVGLVAGESGEEDTEITERGPTYASFPINLVCVNADALPYFVDRVGPDFFGGRHTIGYWWWEIEEFPERYHGSFDHVDEVWAGTRHVADALAAVSPVPVVRVTTPVDVPSFDPLPRDHFGLPDGFLYLFVYDYNSVFARKNPLAVIDAFSQAFEPGEGPALALKCIGHERFPEQHGQVLAAAAERPDVHVLDRSLPRAEKDALIASCDCFVSLHRSEGFGIALAEAMALGKPVVATGYSGNLDYMTSENSWLVDWERVPVGEGSDPYPPGATWAEPDVAHAARLMREVHDGPEAARDRALRGQAEIRRTHSPEAAGRSMARRLVNIQQRWGLRAAGLAHDSRGAVDAVRVSRRINAGPVPASGRSTTGVRAFFRRSILRAMKPYSAFQRNVDEELLHAIQSLDNGLQALAAGQAQLRPQVARLIGESQALPDAAAGIALAEHPVAGVVSGYAGDGATPQPAAPAPDAAALERLLDGREPVLELAGAREPLREAADGSLGAVVAAGVVEGLGQEELPEFFALARAKLAPGGLLVVQTPNPHSPRVMKTFWADPAHVRPLFPEVGLGLCRLAGFGSAFVFHPGGSGNVEADRFYEPSYALVAAPEAESLGLKA